jgi:hypothetical protein
LKRNAFWLVSLAVAASGRSGGFGAYCWREYSDQ